MKRFVALAAFAMLAAACGDDNGSPTGPSNTGPLVFTSQLSAANEVPPVTNAESGGRGTATITINVPRDNSGTPTDGGTVNISVQLSGFPAGTPAVAAHIHTGAAGQTGSPIVHTGLSPATAIVMGDGSGALTFTNIQINQTVATNIMNNPGGFYFNVHTPLNPGGAVRGQLVRQQ